MNMYAYCGNNSLNFVDPSGNYEIAISIPMITVWWNASCGENDTPEQNGVTLDLLPDDLIDRGGLYDRYGSSAFYSELCGGCASACLLGGGGLTAGGIGSKVAYHSALHPFALVGEQPHIMIVVYKVGVSGSHIKLQIPIKSW